MNALNAVELVDQVAGILGRYEALERLTTEQADVEDVRTMLSSLNEDFRCCLDFHAG